MTTAREDLTRAFERHASFRVARMVADEILKKRDRELAEKIRNRPFVEHYGHGTFLEGSETAADLIDPDKE